MGNFARYSPDGKTAAADIVTDCIAKCGDVNTKLTTFATDAKTESATWPGKYVKTSSVEYGGDPIKDDQGNHKKDSNGNLMYTDTYYKYKNNFENTEYNTDSAALQGGKDACNRDYVSPHDRLATALNTAWTTLNGTVSEGLTKISTMLTAIETAATTFDGLSGSLQSVIDGIEGLELGANIGIEVNEFGDEVMYYNVYDEDGNLVGRFTIAEMVNSFYTYTGSAMSGALANELMMEKMYGSKYADMSDEEKAKLRNNYISGIGNNVYQLLGQGFMSVASAGNIEQMYEDLTGNDYSKIADDYSSLLAGKVLTDEDGNDITGEDIFDSLGTGSLIAGGAAIAASSAYNLGENIHSDSNAEEAKERMDGYKNTKKEEEGTDETSEEKTEEKSEETTEEKTEEKTEGGNPWYDGGDNGGNNGGDNGGNNGGENDTEAPSEQPTEESTQLVPPVEVEIPELEEQLEITSQEIDDLARDEFYEQYADPEALAERRQLDIDKFEELYASGNEEALVKAFEDMGYEPADALAAAQNRDIGLQAYMLGSQNREMTDIANSFAKEMGLTENFDTVYDNTPDINDYYDGDLNVALTNPNDNPEVVAAKETYDVAKDAYVESVTTANTSIEAAQTAKTELETIKAEIEAASGKDTTKWSEEQIKKYNEATQKYNTAVTKANEDVEAAEKAKTAYSEAKETYDEAREDFYDSIRREVQEQNGLIDPGEDTMGDATTGSDGGNNERPDDSNNGGMQQTGTTQEQIDAEASQGVTQENQTNQTNGIPGSDDDVLSGLWGKL